MQASRVAVLARAIGVAIVTLWPALAAAQGTTASIAGFVTDDSKASLPGATVTVKHVDTGQARVLTTDGQGRYRADALAPGRYAVTVELSGFRTAQYDDVSLSVGQASTLNVQLQIGGISERVVVSGDATLVATRQSSVAALVDQSQIRELPLNGRDFSQLTLLQLGVTSSPTTSQTVDRGMGTQVSIAGSRPNQISYQLDGADVNTQGNGSPGSAAGGMLGVDTVREFQVLVNNYSAEYGRSSGGIVVAITRSGTNNLTGSAFEFNRDSRFDSRTYFDDPSKPIPPLTRNQFGGTLGGPLVRDQTFFFGSYEGLRQTRGATTIANVPSDATRARTDLSALTRPYLLLYPIANGPQNGASAQFIQQVVSPTRENLAVGKVDHNLTKMQSLSVKYSFDKASVDDTQAIPYWTTDTRTRSQSVVGEHKWILSPRVLNDVKVAWNQAFEDTQNVENRSFDPALQFIPNSRFGTTSITGLTQLGPDAQTPTFVNLKSLQAIDNLTWSRGSHSIKTGVSYTHYMNDQDSSFDLGGVYAFTSIDNFVLGKVNTFEGQVPGSTTARRWRQDLVGLFAQDDWSARRNLTLNAGVRYEFITEPKELDGRSSALPDLQSSTFVTGGAIFKNPSLKNVAPRGGFAWN
ncbi:MAG TPA: carboxypeptidase regulatory-like domain-containing protein, partial [Vicinamibacterales bacterium]